MKPKGALLGLDLYWPKRGYNEGLDDGKIAYRKHEQEDDAWKTKLTPQENVHLNVN